MLTNIFLEVLQHEGVAAIATLWRQAAPRQHLEQLYPGDGRSPSADTRRRGMHQTEENIAANPKVLLTVGAREVAGRRGHRAPVSSSRELPNFFRGEDFDRVRAKFGWARAALKITVESATQTL